MSPALNGSSALQHFQHGRAVEIRNGIMFNFYLGLPQILHFYCVGYQVHYYCQNGKYSSWPLASWNIAFSSGSDIEHSSVQYLLKIL